MNFPKNLHDKLSPHFAKGELACHHCGELVLNGFLLVGLEALRAKVDQAIVVTSGYRCREHNAAVGGTLQSKHLIGEAADIYCPGLALLKLLNAAQDLWMFQQGGIGLYPEQRFIHVDVYPVRRRWGRLKGAYVGFNLALEELGDE